MKKISLTKSDVYLIAIAIGWAALIAIMILVAVLLNRLNENIEPAVFDCSALEVWDGDFSDGNIRMVGGWVYSDGVLETEDGMLWGYDTENLTYEDFLLVWIADGHTEKVTDDVVLKVWKESY